MEEGGAVAKLPAIPAHTEAKHRLLKRYLGAWFPILGRWHRRINYLDGFAGPGEYEGGADGSPIIALKCAKQPFDAGTLGPDVVVNFGFVEADADQADHLRSMIATLGLPKSFRVTVLDAPFRDAVGSLLDRLEEEQKDLAPTFAFIDPFGFKGVPFG